MLTFALVLLALIIGLLLGWFGRTIRDYLQVVVNELNTKRAEIENKRTDKSGVVRPGTATQRGITVPLPSYDPGKSAIVRSPTPAEVKARSDADWEKTVDSYRNTPK